MTSPGPSSRRRTIVRALVLAALAAAVMLGASHLAFLCDDAFITFRYVSNAMDGHGLVWNPPPFRPVEGYTGFLWAMLLWGTWSVFGVEPPDAANVWSIVCGLLTFAVVAAAAFRLRDREQRRLPDVVVFAALAAIASNRTFLQWMTSGLETALFDLAAVAWVVVAFRTRERRSARWLALWSACAAAAALTRPDGLLFACATAAVATIELVRRRLPMGRVALGLSPLLLVVAHVAWRRAFYGEWLPNTYYAKVGDPWPEAGLRYLLVFVVENGVWIWIPLALVWVVVELRRAGVKTARVLADQLPAGAAVTAVVVATAYYVFVVGGDHFEFRVFAHLVPLGGLAAAAMAARLRPGRALPIAAVVSIALAASVAWVIPAIQPTTTLLYEPLSPHVPAWASPMARWYDGHRAWLALQAVGVRCDAHRLFLANETAAWPKRLRTPPPEHDVPLIAADCVGRLGWALPDFLVIDRLGLNDWVVARWPMEPENRDHPTAVERVLAVADRDADGVVTLGEVATAVRATGADAGPENVEVIARQVFLIFGDEPDRLRTTKLPAIRTFFANLRTMAHERHAPWEYVEAFSPNILRTMDGNLDIQSRLESLSRNRIRAIETEWRERVRQLSKR